MNNGGLFLPSSKNPEQNGTVLHQYASDYEFYDREKLSTSLLTKRRNESPFSSNRTTARSIASSTVPSETAYYKYEGSEGSIFVRYCE